MHGYIPPANFNPHYNYNNNPQNMYHPHPHPQQYQYPPMGVPPQNIYPIGKTLPPRGYNPNMSMNPNMGSMPMYPDMTNQLNNNEQSLFQ